MSVMPRTVDVHLPQTKKELQKLNTNAGKFMEKEKRKSIQEAVEALKVINPFEETYSLDNFREKVDYLRAYVLPLVIKYNTSRMGYGSKLKTLDLRGYIEKVKQQILK